MPTRRTAMLLLFLSLPSTAQLSQNMQDWMRRLNSPEFSGRGGGRGGRGGGGAGGRWVDAGKGYTAVEQGEIVRYETASGQRAVLLTAAQLTPPAHGSPIQPGDYASSADGRH